MERQQSEGKTCIYTGCLKSCETIQWFEMTGLKNL